MTTTFAVVKRNAEKIQAWTEFLNSWPLQYLLSQQANRPFRSCPKPWFKTRLRTKLLIWKGFFILMQIKLIFTRKGFGVSFILKVKALGTYKWPVWSWFLSWFIPSWLVNISVGDTIAVVKGLNPTQTWIFFSGFLFATAKVAFKTVMIFFASTFSSCHSNIWFSYIHIVSIMLFF